MSEEVFSGILKATKREGRKMIYNLMIKWLCRRGLEIAFGLAVIAASIVIVYAVWGLR